jgi:hypothetical protein
MTELQKWRVFIASPSDVDKEKSLVYEAVKQLNETGIARHYGVHIECSDWTHLAPMAGQAQHVVFQQAEFDQIDHVLFILKHKFGPHTKEEFDHAIRLRENGNRETPQISVYRCIAPPPSGDGKPWHEASKVEKFAEDIADRCLFQQYEDLIAFGRRIQGDLLMVLDKSLSRPPSTGAVEDNLDDLSHNDEGVSYSDSRVTSATFDDIDPEALNGYLSLWKNEDGLNQDAQAQHQALRNAGLLSKSGYLTLAGAILLCSKTKMLDLDHGDLALNTNVLVHDERKNAGTRPLFDKHSPAFLVYIGVQKYLSEVIALEQGYFVPYPENAIAEALANMFLHRDYLGGENAHVEIEDDRITFRNPGCSLIEERILRSNLESGKSLLPSNRQIRNPALTQALAKTTIIQQQGKGLIRIKKSLKENGSYRPDGELGYDFHSNRQDNTFQFVLYRKLPSEEDRRLAEVIRSLQADLRRAEDSLVQTRQQLVESEKELTKLRDELSKIKLDEKSLQDDLRAAQYETEKLQNERSQVRQDNEATDALKQRLEELDVVIRERESRLALAQDEKSKLESALIQREKDLLALNSAKSNLEEKISTLADEQERLDVRAQGLLVEKNKLQNQTLGLERGLSSYKKQRKAFLLTTLIAATLATISLGLVWLRSTRADTLTLNIPTIDTYCLSASTWTTNFVVEPEGGRLPLTYYWNGNVITPTVQDNPRRVSLTIPAPYTRTLEGKLYAPTGELVEQPSLIRDRVPLEGAIFVVSEDGQTAVQSFAILAPLKCP